MKRINLLYIALIPMIYFVYRMNMNLSGQSILFYGFAENKETELSYDQPTLVNKIWVSPGQHVTKGQILMEVKQDFVEFKKNNAGRDLERTKTLDRDRLHRIRNQISQLQASKVALLTDIQRKIDACEASIVFSNKLSDGLMSLDSLPKQSENSPNQIKLKALQKSMVTDVAPIELEISQLTKELETANLPSAAVQRKLQDELDYYDGQLKELNILAPFDGIVGNILCKEGEHISSFSTMINFYEKNPTLVKGFVHESQLLEVEEGDSLVVSSSLHTENRVEGQVIGLGSRIIEIPERLRKMPEVKTYGREVLIRIPSENPFLQKEKVMLNTFSASMSRPFLSFYSLFASISSAKEPADNELREFNN